METMIARDSDAEVIIADLREKNERLTSENKALAEFAETRRVQINKLMDALEAIADIVPESASEAWMVQNARDAVVGDESAEKVADWIKNDPGFPDRWRR